MSGLEVCAGSGSLVFEFESSLFSKGSTWNYVGLVLVALSFLCCFNFLWGYNRSMVEVNPRKFLFTTP